MISTFMVPCIVPRWVEPRVTIITSSLLLGFATFLIGPFYAEKSLVGMTIGLASSGFLISFMMIPFMPEAMKAMKEEIPSSAGSDRTNSMLSGLFSGFYGAG